MIRASVIFSAFLILFTLISCKKQYSCLCSSTFTKAGYSPYTVSSIEKNSTKTTKKTAAQTCDQAEKQMNVNHADYISGNEKVTVTCAVK